MTYEKFLVWQEMKLGEVGPCNDEEEQNMAVKHVVSRRVLGGKGSSHRDPHFHGSIPSPLQNAGGEKSLSQKQRTPCLRMRKSK